MISAGDMAWFRPLYRRIGLIIVCLGWVTFELVMGTGDFWLTLSILATAYAVWLSLRVHQEAKRNGDTEAG